MAESRNEPLFVPRRIDLDITLDVLAWLRDRVDSQSVADIDAVVHLVEDAPDVPD